MNFEYMRSAKEYLDEHENEIERFFEEYEFVSPSGINTLNLPEYNRTKLILLLLFLGHDLETTRELRLQRFYQHFHKTYPNKITTDYI